MTMTTLFLLNSPIAQPHLLEIYRKTPTLGTPRYNGQNFGSQWCPLTPDLGSVTLSVISVFCNEF